MKPLIGVLPLWDEEKESIWMLPGYMDGIKECGGIPIILPFTEKEDEMSQLLSHLDGLLLTGGDDVNPALYGEKVLNDTVSFLPRRDSLEVPIIKLALKKSLPILGICRGIQLINVTLGGTLYQDIPTECPSSVVHSQRPPYDKPSHSVAIIKESPLYDALKKEKIDVNSYHHQAVKKIAPSLKAMATSPDGLIEALYLPSYSFLWALQWHPEFSYKVDSNSLKIFNCFVEAARK